MYGSGISFAAGLVNLGVQIGAIKKAGAWFSYGDEKIGQGKDNAKQYIIDHPEIADAVYSAVCEYYGFEKKKINLKQESAPESEEE